MAGQVSPHFFRWLLACHRAHESDVQFGGCTLQRGSLRAKGHYTLGPIAVNPAEALSFQYQLVGSWGYSPSVQSWIRFRNWYHYTREHHPDFQPLVKGLVPSEWYETFLKQGRADSMWTMWHIYFANRAPLYTVYANLPNSATLAANWMEAGLHYKPKPGDVSKRDNPLLTEWQDQFAVFPQNPLRLGWNGMPVAEFVGNKAAIV